MMTYLVRREEQPHFERSDMLMMHDMFRREFALMPGLVGGVAAGRDRAQIIGDHIETASTVLHSHHHLEDENIWPLLLDRSAEVAPLVRLMEGQHQQVATLLHQVDKALSVWREGATVDSRGVLVDALDRLIPALQEHLSAEEDRVVPLMEQHITAAEWDEPIMKEMANVDPDQLSLRRIRHKGWNFCGFHLDRLGVARVIKCTRPTAAAPTHGVIIGICDDAPEE
jgi:hemerythrin-like domain-containing protein